MERRAKDQLQLQSKARDHIHQKDVGKRLPLTPKKTYKMTTQPAS
ncbi:hypothetical protein SynROS8604_02601 [Synechococcus sp. ROS8604]|nr:hypothetical protein SynROS8604_02601 [Synechococcus sp. ROS8604]